MDRTRSIEAPIVRLSAYQLEEAACFRYSDVARFSVENLRRLRLA